MTISQIKGMIKLHKKCYKAYKATGQVENAKQARAHMIAMYLKLRATR